MEIYGKEVWYVIEELSNLDDEIEELEKIVKECPIEIDDSSYSDENRIYLRKIRVSKDLGIKEKKKEENYVVLLLDFYRKVKEKVDLEKIIKTKKEGVKIKKLKREKIENINCLNKNFFQCREGLEIYYKDRKGEKRLFVLF